MTKTTVGSNRKQSGTLRFVTHVIFLMVTIPGLTLGVQPMVTRPLIWVTPGDRDAILAKIESQPWAQASFAALKDRVQEAVAQHQHDPNAFLRGLPLVDTQSHPTFPTVDRDRDSRFANDAERKFERYLNIGINCGVLYYLTRIPKPT